MSLLAEHPRARRVVRPSVWMLARLIGSAREAAHAVVLARLAEQLPSRRAHPALFAMINATSSPSAFSPPLAQRGPRPRSRPRALAVAAAVAGSALAPGGRGGVRHAGAARPDSPGAIVALGRLPADAITGRYDRRTLDAVARFRATLGLAVDGVPNAPPADALLRATAT